MTANDEIPEGFVPYPADGSFNDACQPLYIWFQQGQAPRFALKVQAHHLNPMGICHGAVYMALFDMAFPSIIGHTVGKYTGTPTVTINMNCLSPARAGQWLFSEARCDKVASNTAFVSGSLHGVDGQLNATATAVFKLPRDLSKATGFEQLPHTD